MLEYVGMFSNNIGLGLFATDQHFIVFFGAVYLTHSILCKNPGWDRWVRDLSYWFPLEKMRRSHSRPCKIWESETDNDPLALISRCALSNMKKTDWTHWFHSVFPDITHPIFIPRLMIHLHCWIYQLVLDQPFSQPFNGCKCQLSLKTHPIFPAVSLHFSEQSTIIPILPQPQSAGVDDSHT